jgi:hypothetical protein
MFGLEHLGNCHGELDHLRWLIMFVPFAGPWLWAKLSRKKSDCCDGSHDDNQIHP